MSYTPTLWNTGDIVSSQKLNKLENGVKDAGALIIGYNTEAQDPTLDKTWQEIYDAVSAGIPCYISMISGIDTSCSMFFVTNVMGSESSYNVDSIGVAMGLQVTKQFTATDANSYPVEGSGEDIG